MKKIFFVVLILLAVASTCFAEKSEWFDKDFDFTKCKRVLIFYDVNQKLRDGVLEFESRDTIVKTANDLQEFLVKRHGVVHFFHEVTPKIAQYYNVNLNELGKSDPQKAGKFISDYINSHYDTCVSITLQQYGYSQTVVGPSYWYGEQIDAGGIKNVPQCKVFFKITELGRYNDVWRRNDSRAIVNHGFVNKSPRSMFGRIISSFFEDFQGKID